VTYSVKEIAQQIGARTVGNGAVEIRSVASVKSATKADLVFVEDAKFLDAALRSAAAAVVVGDFVSGSDGTKPLLIHPQPRLAFARAAALLVEPEPAQLGVHPTAVVNPSAKLGLGVSVGPHASVAQDVIIGTRTAIGAGVRIGRGVRIGGDCTIRANACVYPGTSIGDRVIVHAGAVLGSDGFGFVRDAETGRYEKFPQVGRLEIGDDVEVGANCTIDRGALDATVIGRGTKLDNLIHVGHNVRIGENVVIAAQTGISGSAVIESNTVIAGQVGIADHVTIEEGAILGAQSGVPSGKVIRGKGVLFWGTPARPIKQYLKELALLARLARK
jgi:UDP-3-O-[3-hydroxymyristoyl] glucosamine N-acyltransferase